jgi:hypothetical protein
MLNRIGKQNVSAFSRQCLSGNRPRKLFKQDSTPLARKRYLLWRIYASVYLNCLVPQFQGSVDVSSSVLHMSQNTVLMLDLSDSVPNTV